MHLWGPKYPPTKPKSLLFVLLVNLRELFSTMPSPLQPPSQTHHHLLTSLLSNCHTMREFKQLHSQMIRTGLARFPAEQTRLLSFCCASPDPTNMLYARLLFDQIQNPDPFLWNTMIRGYSNRNSPEAAVSLYIEMLAKHFKPNSHTFPFLLKSFARETAVQFRDGIHGHVIKFGLGSNPFVQNALIHVCCIGGEIDTARELFERSSKRDAVMWNVMISGLNRNKLFKEACELFMEMEKENVEPNLITFVSVLSACAKLKDLKFGTRVHQVINNSSIVIPSDLKLHNALIEMYAGCGDMVVARKIFETMEVRDVVTWTTMVAGFANLDQVYKARALFDQMPTKDIISWTAMINGYVRAKRYKEALEMFRGMQEAKLCPDEFTVVSVLMACAQLGALELGEWIRAYMDRKMIKMDTFVGNSLIDMYTKCGCVDSAIKIFQTMHQKDKFTWTAMIVGLAINGRGEEALGIFLEMLRASVVPDEITYIGVLSACTHSGLVEEGRQYFLSMITVHGIMPNVTHYGCLVDLLGRAGQLKEAFETITNMPMKPNSTVWGALLSACRVYKEVEMAELAAHKLLELEPENGACYVLLCNLYAKCNKWEELRKMKKVMAERGIKKLPGCSLIEMNGEVHEFVAGDSAHRRSDEIYSKLEDMARELKLAGYVPDTSEVFLDIGEEEKESAVYRHSEKLAIAFGLLSSGPGATIRVVKNLRVCVDCHNAIKLLSRLYGREIIVRDRTRFHHFRDGLCSCKEFW